MFTESIEDYLRMIYLIQCDEGSVSTQALARRMEVSAPSVTGMVKKLSQMKLVKHEPYRGVSLSESGQKVALRVVRHHRLLEQYLAKALGYSWEKVHDEADRLEHYISEEFADKIAALLGNPTTDPHGDPIPSKEGLISGDTQMRLVEMDEGESVLISRVMNSDAKLLAYVASLGIRPAVKVHVLEKTPFEGPLRLRVGSKQVHLAAGIAQQIFVKPLKAGREK